MIIGSKPIDGGYFILSDEERDSLISSYPNAAKYIHPFVGSREFLQGKSRSIMNLANINPVELKNIPPLKDAIVKVAQFREGKYRLKVRPKIRSKNQANPHYNLQKHQSFFM